MTSDEDFIASRRLADARKFLTNALDPSVAPRLAPALIAVRKILADGEWVAWTSVLAEGLRASDITVKTLDTQIRNAVVCGVIEKRGTYVRRSRTDTRELRLVDWPEPGTTS